MVARKQIVEEQLELPIEAKRPRRHLQVDEVDAVRNGGAAPTAKQEQLERVIQRAAAVREGKDPYWPFREEIRDVSVANVIQGQPLIFSPWFDMATYAPPRSGFWELRNRALEAPMNRYYEYDVATDMWAIFGTKPHRPRVSLTDHEWRGLANKWEEPAWLKGAEVGKWTEMPAKRVRKVLL